MSFAKSALTSRSSSDCHQSGQDTVIMEASVVPEEPRSVASASSLNAQEGRSGLIKQTTKLTSLKTADKQHSKDHFIAGDLLNQTSDFASGCTPYNKVAQYAISREAKRGRQNKRHGDNDGGRHTAQGHSRSGAETSKLLCEDSIATAATAAADDKIAECSEAGACPAAYSPPKIDLAAAGTATMSTGDEHRTAAKKKCTSCASYIFQAEYQAHMLVCLRTKYQHAKGKDAVERNKSPPKENVTPYKTRRRSSDILCQICQDDISHLSMDKRQRHVNMCMDKLDAMATGKLDHEHVATHRQKDKEGNAQQNKTEADEKEACDIAEALDSARKQVLPCPVCGQALKTNNSRQVHLKKCAAKFQVPTSILMQRVKEQEKYRPETGILPQTRPLRRRGRVTKRPPQQRAASLEQPHSKLDADTQLAVALSTSMQREQQQCEANVGLPGTVQADHWEPPTHGKDVFAILMTPKVDGKSRRRGKPKSRLQVVPTLLMQSCQEVQTRLGQRVAALLASPTKGDSNVTGTPRFSSSEVTSKAKGNFSLQKDHAEMVSHWSRCGMSGISSQDNQQAYYVASLMPPIMPSTVLTGSKLKKMSNIPGWKAIHPNDISIQQSVVDPRQLSSPNDSTLCASTQTALLLAELAADKTHTLPADMTGLSPRTANDSPVDTILGAGRSASSSPAQPTIDQYNETETKRCRADQQVSSPVLDSHSPLDLLAAAKQSTGFYVAQQESELSELAAGRLLQGLAGMVDNPCLSDLTIHCAQGSTVHAHKFVLAARCPNVLQCSAESGELVMNDYSKQTVLCLLKYLYHADVYIPHGTVRQLQHIAERYDLGELWDACQVIINSRDKLVAEETEVGCSSYRVQQQGLQPSQHSAVLDTDLQHMLKEMWGSESDDSDSQRDKGANLDPDLDGTDEKQTEEEEIEDLYEFMATQRRVKNASYAEVAAIDQGKEADHIGISHVFSERAQSGESPDEGSVLRPTPLAGRGDSASQALLRKLEESFVPVEHSAEEVSSSSSDYKEESESDTELSELHKAESMGRNEVESTSDDDLVDLCGLDAPILECIEAKLPPLLEKQENAAPVQELREPIGQAVATRREIGPPALQRQPQHDLETPPPPELHQVHPYNSQFTARQACEAVGTASCGQMQKKFGANSTNDCPMLGDTCDDCPVQGDTCNMSDSDSVYDMFKDDEIQEEGPECVAPASAQSMLPTAQHSSPDSVHRGRLATTEHQQAEAMNNTEQKEGSLIDDPDHSSSSVVPDRDGEVSDGRESPEIIGVFPIPSDGNSPCKHTGQKNHASTPPHNATSLASIFEETTPDLFCSSQKTHGSNTNSNGNSKYLRSMQDMRSPPNLDHFGEGAEEEDTADEHPPTLQEECSPQSVQVSSTDLAEDFEASLGHSGTSSIMDDNLASESSPEFSNQKARIGSAKKGPVKQNRAKKILNLLYNNFEETSQQVVKKKGVDCPIPDERPLNILTCGGDGKSYSIHKDTNHHQRLPSETQYMGRLSQRKRKRDSDSEDTANGCTVLVSQKTSTGSQLPCHTPLSPSSPGNKRLRLCASPQQNSPVFTAKTSCTAEGTMKAKCESKAVIDLTLESGDEPDDDSVLGPGQLSSSQWLRMQQVDGGGLDSDTDAHRQHTPQSADQQSHEAAVLHARQASFSPGSPLSRTPSETLQPLSESSSNPGATMPSLPRSRSQDRMSRSPRSKSPGKRRSPRSGSQDKGEGPYKSPGRRTCLTRSESQGGRTSLSNSTDRRRSLLRSESPGRRKRSSKSGSPGRRTSSPRSGSPGRRKRSSKSGSPGRRTSSPRSGCSGRSKSPQSYSEVAANVCEMEDVWQDFDDGGGFMEDYGLSPAQTSQGKKCSPSFPHSPNSPMNSTPTTRNIFDTFSSPEQAGERQRGAGEDGYAEPESDAGRDAIGPSNFDPPTDMDTDVSALLNEVGDSSLWGPSDAAETPVRGPSGSAETPVRGPSASAETPVRGPSGSAETPVQGPSGSADPTILKDTGQMVGTPKVLQQQAMSSTSRELSTSLTPMPNYTAMVTPQLKRACQYMGIKAFPKKKMITILKETYQRTHPDENESKDAVEDSSVPARETQSKAPGGKTGGCRRHNSKGPQTLANTKHTSSTRAAEQSPEDLDTDTDSDNDACSAPLEESMLQAVEDSTEMSKRDVAYKKMQVWNYIQGKEDLTLQILHYEPLEFADFHQSLKDAGHSIGAGIVQELLDEQNIQFTMRAVVQTSKDRRAKRRRSPQKRARKGARSTKKPDPSGVHSPCD